MKQLNFILSFCQEKLSGQGEDCYCYAFCESAGLLGSFDGCGGAGALRHKKYHGHTEAYIASRLAAGAVYDAFRAAYPGAAEGFLPGLEPTIRQRFSACMPEQEGFQIRGSLVRTLPTTAAVVIAETAGKRDLKLEVLWAGDSRVFLLTEEGLCQLTVDDTSVPDPMDTIYDDGVLRNLLCADRKFRLNRAALQVHRPCILLTATDGCFSYVSSPMEFEGLLLQTLAQSNTPEEWEQALAQAVAAVAGDDTSMCLAAFGYSDMQALKKAMAQRYAALKAGWLDALTLLPPQDREGRTALWQTYKAGYCRHMKGGV